MSMYFFGSVAILGLFLFIPVSRLIWVFSIRRLEKKLQRKATTEEIRFQRKRAQVLAVPIAGIFAYFFCLGIGMSPNVISH